MAPLVEVARLRYRYPEAEVAALDGVDLVLDGGITVVAGPSGGGKSTLLRLLNGLVPHLYGGRISGRAVVDGHDVLRTPARRLAGSVGFVFQDAERQAVHTTVERDIAFGLENAGIGAATMRERVEEVMADLAITGLRHRAIATLSGGERQRVAVAGALALRPRLLVLDEPLSQLDGAGVGALLAVCGRLAAQGTAVVLSEHRLDELLPAADALVTISAGRVAGPDAVATLAGDLDSAPQVVRLSRLMGWTPPLLDPALVPLPDEPSRSRPRPAGDAGDAHAAWRLEGVACGPRSLLDGVTVTGRAGEITVLMGRNGAGKTTLLRVIAGLAAPRSGTAWRRPGRVAYLPQNPAALLHRQTVAAEIAWTVRRAGRGAAGAEGPILEALGVTAMAPSDPRDLSSGQRQRAAIAAVLCGSPEIALLDEPTRGMDGVARAGLVAAARLLAARGASVVVATHDSDLAAELGDRILRIEEGTVHEAGRPEQALSGRVPGATQLGRLFTSPGPVTVEAVAALLRRPAGAALRS